jgi:hypothetical protein
MYAFPLDLAIFCGQIEPIGEMHHSSDLAAPAISIFLHRKFSFRYLAGLLYANFPPMVFPLEFCRK